MEPAGKASARPELPDGLASLRIRIDEIDLGILRLIEQRGAVVEEILRLKQSSGRAVLDEARERQLLAMSRGLAK